MKRKIVSFAPSGLTALYFDKIEADIKSEFKAIGTTAVMVRLIEQYFLFKYGQEEKQKVRMKYIDETIL